MPDKIWNPRPLHLEVIEILEKKGALTDIDLQEAVEEDYGDISFRELNRVLMKLEITGLVRVTRLMKGKRRVELVQKTAA